MGVATSWSGRCTNEPSGRNPPSVTSRCKCGCQFTSDPWVWIDETMPTERSFSPMVARMSGFVVGEPHGKFPIVGCGPDGADCREEVPIIVSWKGR